MANYIIPYNSVILGDSPLGFWPLSDHVGSTTAVDLTAGANGGTISGSGSTLGVVGGCLDGSTGMQFVSSGSAKVAINNQTLNPAQPPVTIECAMKIGATTYGMYDSAPGQANVLRAYNSGQIEWWNADPQIT